jgi:hypothetical protein
LLGKRKKVASRGFAFFLTHCAFCTGNAGQYNEQQALFLYEAIQGQSVRPVCVGTGSRIASGGNFCIDFWDILPRCKETNYF